jgi:hypothetical protein
MKKLIILASMFTIASFASLAQDLYKNDPGYNVNNYKHPNKAAYAAKKKSNTAIAVTENVVVNRNYKQMGNKTVEKSLEIVRAEPREVYLTRQNYKMPFSTFKREEKIIAAKVDTTKTDTTNVENPID